MFGAFRTSQPLFGGLLWKSRPVMTKPQKSNQRQRLKQVDSTIKNITLGLHALRCAAKGISYEEAIAMEKLLSPKVESVMNLQKRENFLTEDQMSPKNKYTTFSRYSKGYRKSLHKVPHFTKISSRVQPKYM